jgi:hypothetical protein
MSISTLEPNTGVLAPATTCMICRSRGKIFCSSEVQNQIRAIGSELKPSEFLAIAEENEEVGLELEARSPPF